MVNIIERYSRRKLDLQTVIPLKALEAASLQMDPCPVWPLVTTICLKTQEACGTGSTKELRTLFERGVQMDAELYIKVTCMGAKQKTLLVRKQTHRNSLKQKGRKTPKF